MKKLVFAVIIASIAVAFTSCNDDDDDVYVVGDVYAVSQLSGQDTVYGLSIHAYSLSSFSSVKVTNGEGTVYNLKAYPGYETDFYYDTPTGELSMGKPVTGTYHFTATFKSGEVLETDDVLSSSILYPPVIKDCSYDVAKSKVFLEWEDVTDADLYVIKIYKDDTRVFLSPAFSVTTPKVEFDANSSYWENSYEPVTGDNLKLVLSAFMYETGGGGYDVQASTSSETSFVWGE